MANAPLRGRSVAGDAFGLGHEAEKPSVPLTEAAHSMCAVSQKHDRNSSELRGCPYRGRRELQLLDLPLTYASPPGAPRLRMLLRVVPSWLIRLRAAAPPHALQ